ncbi:DNA-processing protein DprA [Reinekea sp.]|jgi:DNA processing protein|uniref:DNA-processing protein DprA n=1 Tax=Reinekea sp. TaxID=1970455 RepID=UPI002A80BDF8|nr:DNA-processing protein DprA [Reinekea sp.]
MHSDTLDWLRWVLVPNLGLKRSQTLLNLIDSPADLFRHPERWPLPESIKTTLRAMNRLGEQHPIHRRALAQLDWAAQPRHQLISLADSAYPVRLSQIDDAPLLLWALGDASLLSAQQVALVGSRHASPGALGHAHQLAADLARAGLVVTSGGALGVDGASHRGALDVQGGTIAVLGCGLDIGYPRSHQSLFATIASQGLLLSEYPLGTQPRPGHFPRRNRLISALVDLVVVVEATLNSGSLLTAQHGLEQGKDIFAMPGDIGNPNTAGCHRLIQDGAYLLAEANDILLHLKFQQPASPRPETLVPANLSPVQQKIMALLRFGTLPLDGLAHHLELAVHQLLEPILELELEGLIEQQPGGYTLSDIA